MTAEALECSGTQPSSSAAFDVSNHSDSAYSSQW